MARNKKKRSEAKKIRSRFAHSNSLDKVIYPLAGLSNKTIKFVICIFLVVMTFAVYSQIQDHEFINFDDHIHITENLHVKAGFSGVVALAKKMVKPETKTVTRTVAIPKTKIVKQQPQSSSPQPTSDTDNTSLQPIRPQPPLPNQQDN